MNDGPGGEGQLTERTARIVYGAVLGGAVVATVAFVVIRVVDVMAPIGDLPQLPFRIGGLVLVVAGLSVAGMISGGITPCRAGGDRDDWWRVNGNRALIAWTLAEGMALVGGVLYMLTGDLVLLVALVGGGLAVLLLNRPGRLMEG